MSIRLTRTSQAAARSRSSANACRVAEAAGGLEQLEPRSLFFAWTAQEVYLSELINRARANPTAEGVRLGVNLNAGLTVGESALLVPREPLALDPNLTLAARAHSADMAARAFFDHINPSGQTPTQRVQAQGYLGSAGENIGAGHASIDALYLAWMQIPDQRRNVLSLYTLFDSTYHYDQFGPGFALNVGGATHSNYYTGDFGNPSVSARTQWLTGVAFTDLDTNSFYGIGEGLGGILVEVFAGNSASGQAVGTYTTESAGAFQLPLASGSYTVRFTRQSDGGTVTKPLTISGSNAKLDVRASELVVPPPPPPDDFPDGGDWNQAPAITLNSLGNGSTTGSLGVNGDTDLFRFVAGRSGATRLGVLPTGGAFTGRIRVYNANQTLIGTGSAGSNAGESVANLTLTIGQTYYLLVDANPQGTGAYTLSVLAPVDPPPPPPPTDDFADVGEWSLAAVISINTSTAAGTRTGSIESAGDADLFKFTAAESGQTVIALSRTAGSGSTLLRVYDGSFSLIATINGAPGAQTSIDLTAGQTYYVLASALDGTSLLDYSVSIDGPDHIDPPPPPPPEPDASTLSLDGQSATPVQIGSTQGIVYFSAAGRAMFATRSAQGTWTTVDIQTASGVQSIAGDLSPWVDPRDGLLYVAARSDAGVIVFKRNNAGAWSARNLTNEIRVSRPIVGQLTTFADSSGLRQIAGFDAQGRLVTYWMTGLLQPRGWRYFFTDVYDRDLTRRNRAKPTVNTDVVSYVTQKNSLNVVTRNAAGQVILFFRPGGGLATQLWNWSNLSQITGTPALVGSLTAAETTGRVVLITGVDASGNAWTITWRSGEGWRSTNMTASSGGLSLRSGSVSSWVNGTAGFIAGVTLDGQVVLYRLAIVSGAKTFSFASISAGITNPPTVAGSLRTTFKAGAITIVALNDENKLIRFSVRPNESWTAELVTDLLNP